MREMKDSGIAWIGVIPQDWEIVRTKSLYCSAKEIAGDRADDFERLALTLNGVIKRSKEDSVGLQPEKFSGYQILKKGELVFKLIDLENVATSRVGLSPYTGIVSPAYIVLSKQSRAKDLVVRYSMYHFLSMWQREIFNQMGDNGVRSSLNAKELLNIPHPFPSIYEQKRIVTFLDAQCAEIDAVLEKTRESIEEYKKLKQAVITQAVTKGVRGDRPMKDSGIEWIGEIPVKWKVASIGRFCFVTKLAGFEFTNDMMSNIQDSGDIPIVRAQNIKMGKFINNISEFIPYRISQKLDRCALNRKCLIITFIGAGIGEVAIFNEPKRYHLAPNVAKIVINVGMEHFVTEEYLLYFLMSFAGQEEINKIKKATAQPSLSMGTIRSIKMVLPDSIEEQSEIVSYLDMRCASIDALIAKKQQYLTEIENYKKSLIYEYVTGKKEVKTSVLAD